METLQALTEILDKGAQATALTALGAEDSRSWSYAQLAHESERLANGQARDGLEQGGRVALIGESGPAWIIACLAVLRAGGACVPIDNQFSDDQLRHALKLAHPPWAFVDAAVAERIASLDMDDAPDLMLLDGDTENTRHWSRLKQEDKTECAAVSDEDDAVIFFTSGTTGPPKGVPLTHRNLLHQLKVLKGLRLVTADDRLLLPLPLHHAYPFTIGMLAEHGKVPLVPVLIEGAEEALPPGRFWPKPKKIRVRFGEPLDPAPLEKEGEGEKSYQRIIDALYKRMKAQLDEKNNDTSRDQ